MVTEGRRPSSFATIPHSRGNFFDSNLQERTRKFDLLRSSFEEHFRELNAENWQTVFAEFLSESISFRGDKLQEEFVKSWLASLLEKSYYAIRNGSNADTFGLAVNSILSASPLPNFLKRQGDTISEKNQPSFLESVSETIERFVVAEKLKNAFEPRVMDRFLMCAEVILRKVLI